MIFATFFLTFLLEKVWGQSIDLRTGVRVTHAWMETGFVDVGDAEWVTVSSIGQEYVQPIILTALPDIGGELYTQGVSTATRIRNVVNTGGQVTFDVKVNQPDSIFIISLSSSNLMILIAQNNGTFLNILVPLKLDGLLLNMVLTMFPQSICL